MPAGGPSSSAPPRGAKGEGRSIDLNHLPRTSKGTAVLFNCKSGERAFESDKYEHGVFFHHVIEGLQREDHPEP